MTQAELERQACDESQPPLRRLAAALTVIRQLHAMVNHLEARLRDRDARQQPTGWIPGTRDRRIGWLR